MSEPLERLVVATPAGPRVVAIYDVTGADGEPAYVAGDPRTGALRRRSTRYGTRREARAAAYAAARRAEAA